MSAFSSLAESWQTEFEEEEINDERWSCIVSAVVETKPEDEECFNVLSQCMTEGKFPLIRTLSMSDVICALKSENWTESGKNKEKGTKAKETQKEHQNQKSSLFPQFPPPRYREVVSLAAKHAVFVEGRCKLDPKLMAYLLKYLILCLKDRDYFQRMTENAMRRKEREAELRMDVIRKIHEDANVRVLPKESTGRKDWCRNIFDIFDERFQDGPFNGPELYIVLHDLYDPTYFSELCKIHVPVRGIVKIENFKPFLGNVNISGKKSDLISNFWRELRRKVNGAETSALFENIALLKYMVPVSHNEDMSQRRTVLAKNLVLVLYSIFNLHRLHQTYIQEMKVHEMEVATESLVLSKCDRYNSLCDTLITDSCHAELFVLFSVIEQIVTGVPETESIITKCVRNTSDLYILEEDGEQSIEMEEEEKVRKGEKTSDFQQTPLVTFHDDPITLKMMTIDKEILTPNEVFERFLINSILMRIHNKFPQLTDAEKAQNDFQFFRIWEKSKDRIEMFKMKIFFSIAMKLIERKKAFTGDDKQMSSSLSQAADSENTIESENLSDDSPEGTEGFPKIYFFQEVVNLFYKEIYAKKDEQVNPQLEVLGLRKAKAISDFVVTESSSIENIEVTCRICPKMKFEEEKKPADCLQNVSRLQQLLESCEISYLNESNLLVNKNEFDTFIQSHNFYETLEPNRMVQRLQQLFDEHNTTEYTYFPPTDTLFVLGHNDADFRGIYHYQKNGFIPSPVGLRDFFIHVLPEKKKWEKIVNSEYISFLERVKQKRALEEHNRNHEYRCRFLRDYHDMTNSEKEAFKELRNGKETQSVTPYDLEELPLKEKQCHPIPKFYGINLGALRTQINDTRYEFHSQDGTVVEVKTQAWLYAESVVTLRIRKLGSELYVHKWMEDGMKKSLQFRDPTGLLVSFGIGTQPLPAKITWPNGLIISINQKKEPYVRQAYLENYRRGITVESERCRCCLRNGQIIIFRVGGKMDILCPSGTKYCCHQFTEGDGIQIYEKLTSTGELWVRDDSSGCTQRTQNMKILTETDKENGNTLYKREDGTNFMLWPDGKLTTAFPDGTKITTIPEFGIDEITVEDAEAPYRKQNVDISDSLLNRETDDGFVVVNCTFLMEHPNYATVFSKYPNFQLRMFGKTQMEVFPTSNHHYKLKSNYILLNISSETAEFYSACRNCGKKSISKIFLESEEVLCKTTDYFNRNLFVYSSGHILYKAEEEVKGEDEGEEEAETSPSKNPSLCSSECHKMVHQPQRCLVLERDLTGYEFIHDTLLHRYIGSLSEDAYYDLERLSNDKTFLQHGFFHPVYEIGKEKYLMTYEENDEDPSPGAREKTHRSCTTSKCIWGRRTNSNPTKRQAKALVARFVRLVHPEPLTVLRQIQNAIILYQKRALELSSGFRCKNKLNKQTPFARFVARELESTACNLCPKLELYEHTSTFIPRTDLDLHRTAHNQRMSDYYARKNSIAF